MRLVNLTGRRFGRLLVRGRATKYGVLAWECKCDCGRVKVILPQRLKRGGPNQSCGCDGGDANEARALTQLRNMGRVKLKAQLAAALARVKLIRKALQSDD